MSQRRSGPCGLFSRAEKEMKLSDDVILLIRLLYGAMAHVNYKFERKTKRGVVSTEVEFSSVRAEGGENFSDRASRTTKCLSENEREEFSTRPFLLWHFSPGDKIENCPAQFLAVCWIVHVEFKIHRFRDGFSVSNALLLD